MPIYVSEPQTRSEAMDLNSIASGVVSQTASQKTGDAVGVTVARKAMDIQADAAAQLISSVTPTKTASEPHLGNNVDVRA